MLRIIDSVIYQHAENVCFLWWQWHLALTEPHYDVADLRQLEQRIEANLSGLRIAGDSALIHLQELHDAGDVGAVFAMAMLAVERGDQTHFLALASTCSDTDTGLIEIASALAWARQEHLQRIVLKLLESHEPAFVVLGLQACEAHGRNPGKYLHECITHGDTGVRTMAYQVAANLGNTETLTVLPRTTPREPAEHFELARTLMLLGRRREGRLMLEELALGETRTASRAIRLLLLSSDSTAGRSLLKKLDTLSGRERDVVRGFGLLGDPIAMEWLIERGESLPLARLAGESIALITGLDLSSNTLSLTADPHEDVIALNDDPADEHVDLDEDENLPWPDTAQIRAWWQSSAKHLTSGTQYLCGRQKSPQSCRLILDHGQQRQRTVAADLLALDCPGTAYCNTQLPTHRQQFDQDAKKRG